MPPMTDATRPDTPKPEKSQRLQARDARLKAALKANMAKRKAQMRGRAEQADESDNDSGQ
jgi:hypothetical protein